MAGFLNWLKYTFKWTKYKENKLNKKENFYLFIYFLDIYSFWTLVPATGLKRNKTTWTWTCREKIIQTRSKNDTMFFGLIPDALRTDS